MGWSSFLGWLLDVDDKDAPSSYAVEIADSGLLSREEGERLREAERAARRPAGRPKRRWRWPSKHRVNGAAGAGRAPGWGEHQGGAKGGRRGSGTVGRDHDRLRGRPACRPWTS